MGGASSRGENSYGLDITCKVRLANNLVGNEIQRGSFLSDYLFRGREKYMLMEEFKELSETGQHTVWYCFIAAILTLYSILWGKK